MMQKGKDYINAPPCKGLKTTMAIAYFTTNKKGNPILDLGENAIISITFP